MTLEEAVKVCRGFGESVERRGLVPTLAALFGNPDQIQMLSQAIQEMTDQWQRDISSMTDGSPTVTPE